MERRLAITRSSASAFVGEEAPTPPPLPAATSSSVLGYDTKWAKPKPPAAQTGLEQMIGLKLAGWVGAIVLVIGKGLRIKYAYDQGWLGGLPPAARLMLMYCGGFGFRGICVSENQCDFGGGIFRGGRLDFVSRELCGQRLLRTLRAADGIRVDVARDFDRRRRGDARAGWFRLRCCRCWRDICRHWYSARRSGGDWVIVFVRF